MSGKGQQLWEQTSSPTNDKSPAMPAAVAPDKAAGGPSLRRPLHLPAHLGNAAQVVAGISDAETQDQG